MCKLKFDYGRLTASVGVSALALLGFLASTSPDAMAQCPIGTGSSVFIKGAVQPGVAHYGDTVTINTLFVRISSGDCTVTNGQSFIMYPDGKTNINAGGSGASGIQMWQNGF